MKTTQQGDGVRFEVRARPRAKRSSVRGEKGEAVEIDIAAPPVDGAANEELVRLLARVFDIPKSRVHVLRGESARTKLVEVTGVDESTVRAAIAHAAHAGGS